MNYVVSVADLEVGSMAEFDSYPAGTPSWVDLSSSDTDGSRSFYSALFGWEVADMGPESGGYAMFKKNGKLVAGLTPAASPEQPCVWTTYVSVDDADATAQVVNGAGGTILVAPMDVLDVGRMSVFGDTTGAVIAVWQPRSHKGAELCNESGALCWNELQTTDVPNSKSFYGDVFGWGSETSNMAGMTYTEWKRGEDSIAGMMPLPDDLGREVQSFWLVYFGVDDTDLSVQKANDLGGSTFADPIDIPAGRFAVLGDPLGAPFGIIKL